MNDLLELMAIVKKRSDELTRAREAHDAALRELVYALTGKAIAAGLAKPTGVPEQPE